MNALGTRAFIIHKALHTMLYHYMYFYTGYFHVLKLYLGPDTNNGANSEADNTFLDCLIVSFFMANFRT